jgi:cyclophilin family peptidyl-prolyl cis-trans isomerase
MHKRQILTLAVVFFMMMNVFTSAQGASPAPSAPKPGPANDEFQRIFVEWKTLVGQLGSLRAQYRTASKEEQPAIKKQWDELIEKGKVLQPKFYQAAEKAFIEAPNADKQITELLMAMFNEYMARDDAENALRLGKLLVDNRCGDAKTASDLGLAAVWAGDFDAADKYFAKAKKENFFKEQHPGDDFADMAKMYFTDLDKMKKNWDKEQQIRQAEEKANDLPRVLLKTDKGDIELELFENEAPNTVANFITLVDKGFYNGLTFHRVLADFMAQGGDPKGDGTGGPGYNIPDECKKPNHRLHFRGSLSMAKEARPDSGGSQFFITFVPTSHLDSVHTVFGRVISGIDVLAKIQRRNPDTPNSPDPDKIIEAKVLRKRPHEYAVKKM